MNHPLPDDMDNLAGRLKGMVAAEPGHVLMARLRAARPSQESPRSGHTGPAQRADDPISPSGARAWMRSNRTVWFTAAAAMVVLCAWGISSARRPQPAAPASAEASATSSATAPASAPARGSITPVGTQTAPPLYLPVDSSQRLVSLQAVPVAAGPDQAPRHVYRAVIMEDVAAVNAEADSVLLFSRPREVYLAAGNAVY